MTAERVCPDCWAEPGQPHELSCPETPVEAFLAEVGAKPVIADDLADAVRQYLDQLGDTADAVADNHRARGIKGRRGDGCHCPLAVGIRQAFPDVNVFGIGTYKAAAYALLDADVSVELPTAVTEFVKRVDDGVYLDLILVDTEVTA